MKDKSFLCAIGLHRWSAWSEIPGSFIGDPGGWYWRWKEQRTCTCGARQVKHCG